MQRLSMKGMAMGLGVSWGVLILTIGFTSMFGWGTRLVEMMSSLYIGYSPTVLGAMIGALWALLDGAFGGLIIAFILPSSYTTCQ